MSYVGKRFYHRWDKEVIYTINKAVLDSNIMISFNSDEFDREINLIYSIKDLEDNLNDSTWIIVE